MTTVIRTALDGLGHGGYKTAADAIGTSKDVIYNLATGRTSPNKHRELIESLRQFLHKPTGWPFDAASSPSIPVPEGYVEMPYAGLISAGRIPDWTDPYESNDIVAVPSHMSERGHFAARVDGDSMFDFLWPNDLCIFKKTLMPQLGSVVMYRHPDMTATIKQLKHDGGEFVLHALNRRYEDVAAVGTSLGFLVGLIRDDHGEIITRYNKNGLFPRT